MSRDPRNVPPMIRSPPSLGPAACRDVLAAFRLLDFDRLTVRYPGYFVGVTGSVIRLMMPFQGGPT